ncbi:MAG TPA: aldehyde dehydrogenase family protein, partial [Steroidobacteraceae bacterium]
MALSAVKAVPVTEPVRAYSLYINGQWSAAASGELADDFNPSTGALYARVAQAGRTDTLRAIDAAHKAREGWARMVVAERAATLLRVADLIASRAEELRDVLIDESGSTFGKAMFEVHYCVDLLRSAAGDARHIFGETLPHSAPGQVGMTVRQPLGVIGGIAPFNAPFLLAMKKVALALAAGNCFVLKPSEETPVIGLKIAELFADAGL